MPVLSSTLVSSNSHPDNGLAVTITSEKFKGDGYYGRSDGLHTVQLKFTGLTGTFKMQGSLAIDPSTPDWFDIDNTNLSYNTATNAAVIQNFTGNFVWLRCVIVYTTGTVNFVLLNH
jgi:hypothetical protein